MNTKLLRIALEISEKLEELEPGESEQVIALLSLKTPVTPVRIFPKNPEPVMTGSKYVPVSTASRMLKRSTGKVRQMIKDGELQARHGQNPSPTGPRKTLLVKLP